jgi:hypothetical protein
MLKRFAYAVVLAMLLSSPAVFGQSLGGIVGDVKDGTGAVVVGATVTVKNTDTNASRTMPSNESGLYSFPALVPGNYTVRVEMPGFRPAARSLQLQVQQTARVDFTMEVGQVTEQVDVSAAATLLTTDDATVGTVIEQKRITDLPAQRQKLPPVGPPQPQCHRRVRHQQSEWTHGRRPHEPAAFRGRRPGDLK